MGISEEIILNARNNTRQAFNQVESDGRKAASALKSDIPAGAKETGKGLDLVKLKTGALSLALTGLVVGAGAQLIQFGKASVVAAEESARAQAQLEAVLRSTGGAAGLASGEMLRLASPDRRA